MGKSQRTPGDQVSKEEEKEHGCERVNLLLLLDVWMAKQMKKPKTDHSKIMDSEDIVTLKIAMEGLLCSCTAKHSNSLSPGLSFA